MTEELESLTKRISNRKWRLFIDRYFELNMNATKAYQDVYGCSYDAARTNGANLLAKANIKEEIDRRMAEKAMGADEVLARLADQARGDIGDFASIKDSIDLANHPQSHIVKKFKKQIYHPKNGSPYEEIELELYDAHAPLVDIGRVHTLFSDRVEHTGKDGGPIEFKEAIVELPPDEPVDS
jgi:hypothetical protein